MHDINFQSFIDNDHSPFILFDHKGKIIYLNSSAEILFGYVSTHELYDIAIRYAPKTFGHKTTTISLNYDNFSFYAISVGYEDEKHIYIRLYNTPRIKQNTKLDTSKLIITDINLLLEVNLTLFKTKSKAHIQLLADLDIPAFKIDQNRFSKLLRKTLESFIDAKDIEITLKLLVGEHIIINEKRFSIVQFNIKSNTRDTTNDKDIISLAKETLSTPIMQQNEIRLEIPLVID